MGTPVGGDGQPQAVQTVVGAFDDGLDDFVNSFQSGQSEGGDGDGSAEGDSDSEGADNSSDDETGILNRDGDTSELDTEEDDDSDDEGEDDGDAEAEKSADTKSEKGEPKTPQKVVLTHKGQQIELDETATLKVRVDGKVQEVSIGDLKKDFAGRQVYEVKFDELHKERQVVQAEKMSLQDEKTEWKFKLETVDTELNKIFELAKTDSLKAYIQLCNMAGLKTKDQIVKYVEQAQNVIGRLSQMTDEQKAALLDRIDNEQERWKLDKEKEKVTKIQKTSEFQNNLKTMLKTAGVDISEYLGAFDILQKKPEVFNGLDEDGIAKKVLDFVFVDRAYNRVEAGIKLVNPKLLSQDGFVERVVQLTATQKDFTPKDIADVVRAMVGSSSKPAKKDSSAVSKKAKTGTPGKKNSSVETSNIDKIISSVMESEI